MRRWLLVVLLACAVSGCESSSDWAPIQSPVAAPNFTLPQLTGGSISLAAFRDHPVIMEFWATWCGPCHYSTPSLEAIYREYRNQKVSVLLINEGESAETVRTWVKGRFTAPILLDEEGRVAALYSVSGLPTLIIVDRDGRIRYVRSGYSGGLEQHLRRVLKDLLASPTAGHGGSR